MSIHIRYQDLTHSTHTKTNLLTFTDGKIDFKHQRDTPDLLQNLCDLETAAAPPLVVLHGGPGLTHNYLVPFSDIATKFNIPVIIYDQLGNELFTSRVSAGQNHLHSGQSVHRRTR